MSSAYTQSQIKPKPRAVGTGPKPATGDYLELIRRLLHRSSAVAVISCGTNLESSNPCEDIAAELAVAGKRVVVVMVNALLRGDNIGPSDEEAFAPGKTSNVWLWPWAVNTETVPLKSSKPLDANNWLNALRRSFDAVLLDCPALSVIPGVTEVAAMADATVLVVEAGRTSKQQILNDQHALQLSGARLAGCILIRKR